MQTSHPNGHPRAERRPTAETTAQYVERTVSGARLRVLCIGAGIAGATLAALMRRRGEPIAVIERADMDGR